MIENSFDLPPLDLMANLFDALPTGIVALDEEGRVVFYNGHEERLAGRKRERVVGRRFFEEVAPCMNVRELGGVFRERVTSLGLDERVEFSFAPAEGKQPRDVIVRLRSFVVGQRPHALVAIEDVTFERSVARLRKTLSELLVHDLKSPLAVILANLEFLREEGGPPSQVRGALDDATAGAERIRRMVYDLLDIARLEVGTFPLHVDREADAGALLEATFGAVRALAHERDVELVTSCGPLLLPLDPGVFRRILENLVDNAVRHAPARSRVLGRASFVGPDLVVDIVDEGEGVPAELRERIFDRDVVLDARGERSARNHGLGLTFVRMAARAHGGDVEVLPGDGGAGSCFRVRIPRARDQ